MKLGIILCCIMYSMQVLGQIENCINLNGIDQYVLVGDVNNLGNSDFTLEAWINVTALDNNAKIIVRKGITIFGDPSNAGYSLRIGNSFEDEIEFIIGNVDGSLRRVSYRGLQEGIWHHVAGVKSGTNLILYFDGVKVAEEEGDIIYNVDNDRPLAIGAIDRGPGNLIDEYFNGKIDEVRIWNSARSEIEINENIDCALKSIQDNLIGVYNFDLESGNSAIDNSGFDNNGLLLNGEDWTESEVAVNCIANFNNTIANSKFIRTYPNPFDLQISIAESLEIDSYSIYNINGELIVAPTEFNGIINTENLLTGIYILKMDNSNGSYINKVVKK